MIIYLQFICIKLYSLLEKLCDILGRETSTAVSHRDGNITWLRGKKVGEIAINKLKFIQFEIKYWQYDTDQVILK